MSFSPLKQENEQLSSYKGSSPWTSFFITEEQAQILLKTAIPITLPYTDLQGRTIQLMILSLTFELKFILKGDNLFAS
jgi:hypothetical protein